LKDPRILEITGSGAKPFVEILVDDLTDQQAVKPEAELISAFGTSTPEATS
jgi:hypothetical protein